jgi:hypothetical protein
MNTVKDKVKKMRNAGLSFAEIGRAIKKTRQRAHQIYHSTK